MTVFVYLQYFNVISRLVGCQDLLEDIPWRSDSLRRSSVQPTSPDGKGFMSKSKSFHGRSSSKSYTVKDDEKMSSMLFFVKFSKKKGNFHVKNK